MPSGSAALRILMRLSIAVALVSLSFAQDDGITADNATPVFGAGHDYIHGLSEIVNPADGSLSLRLSVPIVPGRQLALPFSFSYDSNGAHMLVAASGQKNSNWTSFGTFLNIVGWSYTMPLLSHTNKSTPGATGDVICKYIDSYILQDPQGIRHSFPKAAVTVSGCQNGAFNDVPDDSDDYFSIHATLTNVWVADASGTTYIFPGGNCHPSAGNTASCLPTSVEDRNGNQLTISDLNSGSFKVVDTLGRLSHYSSGFGASGNVFTVPDLANSYSVTWGTVPVNFTPQSTNVLGTAGCTSPPSSVGSQPAITAITLPNGKQYTFEYESTFGLLSKITYPTGGYVQYVWQRLNNAAFIAYDSGTVIGSNICQFYYSRPSIKTRLVSYDGSTIAEEQDFNITTSCGVSKCLFVGDTVTTFDRVRQTNFQTVYTYTSVGAPKSPYNDTSVFDTQFPVEQSIVYKDVGGATLRTVNKTWKDLFELSSEQTVLDNGQTSQVTYTYGPGAQVTEKDEYDFGSGAPGNLLRKTVTNYQAFANTPIYTSGSSIFDKPCQTIVYDGSGTRVAETDYLYDGGTVVCGAAATLALSGSGSYTGHDETSYGTSANVPRGNLASMTKQCFVGSTSCSNATSIHTYDETGQLISQRDPKGNIIQYSFADNYQTGSGTPPGTTNAYLTTITFPTVNGITQHKYFQYAYSDGQLTQSQDDNQKTAGLSTSYAYNDNLRRLTEKDSPDGGQTLIAYNDAAPSPSTTTCSNINGAAGATCSAISPPTGWKVGLTKMDGLGQVVQTQLASDPEGADLTDTTYDGMGRIYTQSNPHRSSSSTTDGTTTHTYDALGRTTKVAEPDGSSVVTSYSGNQTTVSDELGDQRTSVTDGLGRLIQVLEDPGSSPHLNYETDYTYDALNNLLSVSQKGGTTTSSQWRTRTFAYDSLSRLICAANPEIQIVTCPASAPFPFGAITYTYDANGNVASKTAPSPNQPSTGTATVTTSYNYDALNRLASKGYTDGYAPNSLTLPSIYGYDGKAITGCPTQTPPGDPDNNAIGYRTSMCDGSGATNWTHDSLGRILQERRTIGAVAGKNDTDAYNLDGSVATTTSLGFQYSYTYDGAGRPISALGGNTFVQSGSVTYAPFGGLTSAKMGPTPITITNAYNNRLQPLLISAAAGASTIMSLCYDFHMVNVPQNNTTSCQPLAGSGDNGNVFQIVNNRDNNRTQNFLYDPLNRISQAYSSGPNWGETFGPTATAPGTQPTSPGIDAWGNLTNRSGVTGKTVHEGLSCTGNTQNRLGSCSLFYDAAGNMITNGNTAYTYDAENRIIATSGISYIYDGNGKRVEKCTQGATPGTCATGATGTLYWTGPGSEPLAETDLAGNVLENYIFFNGQRIARREPGTTPTIHFYFSDHLGSHGVVTDKTGGTCEQDIDYYPYGGVEQDYCPTVSQHFKFTGKQRDSESGLDNFGARYDASSLGRFMTPDPSPNGVAPGDPQSWNLYSYVRNRPTRSVDIGGNWATDVHAEIVTVALQGLVSVGELKQLVAEQYVMDKNQDPEFQYRHAMSNGESNPPQSAAEASGKMWDYVATMIAGASATLGPNGQFNSVSLAYLGDAIHTVEDYTSPMHTSSSGEPLPWRGVGTLGLQGAQHWQGENSPSDSWAGFGQAVRLTMAAFLQANPKLAAKNGLTAANLNAEADRRISQYVENFYRMSGNVMSSNNIEEDAARQCALGNPAACDR